LTGWSLINWLAIAVGLIVLGLLAFLSFRRRTRAEESRQRPEAIAASAAPGTETKTFEKTLSDIELPGQVTKEKFLGIQASEQEAFREFLDERVSKPTRGIETATPRASSRDEVGGSLQLSPDEDFATEAAVLLLQERTLRSAAEALEAKLAAAKARREFEETSRHQGEGRTLDAHAFSKGDLDSDAVPTLEEENRYRREAETLRKAAGELARKRQAVEAVRTAEETEVALPAEEQKQAGMPDAETLSKRTVSNY
jgi:hypothetical protein